MRCWTARNLAPAFWPSDYPWSCLDVATVARAGSLSSRGGWLKLAAVPPGSGGLCWLVMVGTGGREAATCTDGCQSRRLQAETSTPGSLCGGVRRGGDADGGRSSVGAPGSPSYLWFAVTLLAKFFCPLVFKASDAALLARKES